MADKMYQMVSTESIIQVPKGEKTRQRVLEAAARLITIKGYHNTSMNDIIGATGVKKGNLYFHFSSKDDLVYALISYARKEYAQYLRKNTAGTSAREKLASMMNAVGRYHSRSGFVGGCIFGNMALEVGDENPRIVELVRAVFREWADMIGEMIRYGIDRGEIPGTVDPERAAWQTIATLEGAVMMAKLTKHEEDFFSLCESFLGMLFAGTGKGS